MDYQHHTPSKLCSQISNKLFVDANTTISNAVLFPKKEGDARMRDNGVTTLTMKNVNVDAASFKKDLDAKLTENLLMDSTETTYPELYKNFCEFLDKMVVKIVPVPGILPTAYCKIERHDTIGRFTKSESDGDRCDALNKFSNVMEWVVTYIKDNNNGGNISQANSRFSNKLFNYPAQFENTGSGIQESYKACNNGSRLPSTGGSKSRRTRRRKHARKTHHKRKHRSRAARKHKKHTRR